MRISVKMTGGSGFERIVKRLTNRKNFEKPVETLVEKIAKLAALYAPRDTGDLEGSIKPIKLGFGKFAVVATVPWAEFMEFGTRYFPVGTAENPRARTSTSGKACFHPFLRSATYQMMSKYPDIIKKSLFGKF